MANRRKLSLVVRRSLLAKAKKPQLLPLSESPEEIQILSFSADSNPPESKARHHTSCPSEGQTTNDERPTTKGLTLGTCRKSRELYAAANAFPG